MIRFGNFISIFVLNLQLFGFPICNLVKVIVKVNEIYLRFINRFLNIIESFVFNGKNLQRIIP